MTERKPKGGSGASGSALPGPIEVPGMPGEIAYPIFSDENGTTYRSFNAGKQFTVPAEAKPAADAVDPAPDSDPRDLRERGKIKSGRGREEASG